MKVYKQLAGQTLIYGLGTMVPKVLNYILLTPFYTRIFLQEKYGVITEIYAYVAFLMVLLTYGMETTFFRFSSDKTKKDIVYNTALSSLLVTTFIFLAIVFFNINGIANSIGYSNNINYVKWFALIVSIDVITAIPFARLRLENKALKFTLIKISNILINILINVFFLVICRTSTNELLNSFYNPKIGVGYAFISNLVASIFTLILLLPQFKFFKFNFNKRLFKEMIYYAMPLLIVGLAGMVNEVADKILIKYLTPDVYNPMKQLGIYGANYKLAVLMTIFIQMFKYAAEPFFFNQSKNIDAKVIYSKVMTYFVVFCLLIFLMVTLFIDVFKYFIDPKYFEGLHIVPIVLFGNMFLGVYYNLSVWYKLNNLTKFGAYIAILGMIITIIINFIYVPVYGFIASAWATFICYFIMMMVSYFLGRKYYSIKYNLNRIFIYTGIAIAFFSMNKLIDNLYVNIIMFLAFILLVIRLEEFNISQFKSFIKK